MMNEWLIPLISGPLGGLCGLVFFELWKRYRFAKRAKRIRQIRLERMLKTAVADFFDRLCKAAAREIVENEPKQPTDEMKPFIETEKGKP